MKKLLGAALVCLLLAGFVAACGGDEPAQEPEGGEGVVEVYNGGKLVRRFLRVDDLSWFERDNKTMRYGYGILDDNQNGQADAGEVRVYFEFPAETAYLLYTRPTS